MSQIIDGPRKAFIASETAQANLRWYVSDASTSPPTVSLCDAATPSIGVNEAAVLAADDLTTLYLSNASGTRKMVAAGVITGGNNVYAAADGEVASSGTILEGTAFETTTADQDILEVMATFGEDVDEDWADDETLEFGTGDDAILMWSTGDADNHTVVVGLGDTNEALHVTDKAARASNWAVSADTHPTIYIHSNTTPITDYVKIGAHNGTAAWLGDVVGGGTAFIGFDGLECLEFTETASAVNHVGVVNAATGDKPIIRAEGECDTGLIFDSADGEEALILVCTASAVNEITIASAATGDGPTISVTGETNVNLNVTPAGTGDVVVSTGHITMGDGGTVTQGTNKSTGVTLSTESGQITMHGAALADDAAVQFTVTNTCVGAADVVIANLASANTASAYTLTVDAVASGSFKLSLRNHSGGTLSEAVVINFAVIGGASS